MTAKDVAPRLHRALEQVRRNECDLTCASYTSSSASRFPRCFYCDEPVLPGQSQSSWPVGLWGDRAHAHMAVGNRFRMGSWD